MPILQRHRAVLCLLLGILLAGLAGPMAPVSIRPALAQDNGIAPDDPLAKAPQAIDELQRRLDGIAAAIQKDSQVDRELLADQMKIEAVRNDIGGLRGSLLPRQEDVANQLRSLGDAPKGEGQTEPADVTQQRQRLGLLRTTIAATLLRVDDLDRTANDLVARVAAQRRALFTKELLAHTDVSIDTMTAAVQAVGPEVSRFDTLVSAWASFAWRFKKVQLASALLLSVALAFGLHIVLNRIFGPMIVRRSEVEEPSYMSRFSSAFWATIIPSLAFTFFLTASYFLLDVFNVMRPDISPIIATILGFFGFSFFALKLSLAVFNPRAPKWRLVRVSNRGARLLVLAFVAMAVINGFDYVLGSIAEVLDSPVEISVLRGFFSAQLIGLILLWVSFAKPLLPKGGASGGHSRGWPRRTKIVIRLLGLVLIGASVIGYVGFARFLSTQIILTGGVLATMYIGIRSGRAVSERDRFAETVVGRFLQRKFDIGPVALDQLGIAAGLLIYAFALMIGFPLILISWGFQVPDIQTWFYNLFVQISIGGINISILGIAGGIAIFLLGLLVTRWFEKWLDGNVMARSQVDPGVRNSVKTSVGYLGAIVAAFIALSAAGINLSSLALVAGALSVGIGFGLQNIISNFVSGLILLFERPFKVGDWVATGTSEGFVRRISVRATEIETFQRQSIIVPNSQLINASVGNWTHRNKLGRVEVKVVAKAVNDPRELMALLKKVATDLPGVLRNPEPVVVFKDFNGIDLEFEVRVFVGDVLNGLTVRNELRLSIFEKFKSEGVVLTDAAPEPPAPVV